MLTWAPVEITNFCYVIGVTKESLFWFLEFDQNGRILDQKLHKELISECLRIFEVHNNGKIIAQLVGNFRRQCSCKFHACSTLGPVAVKADE